MKDSTVIKMAAAGMLLLAGGTVWFGLTASPFRQKPIAEEVVQKALVPVMLGDGTACVVALSLKNTEIQSIACDFKMMLPGKGGI